jgi:hypothetical protein
MPLTPPQSFRKTDGIHRIGLLADRPSAADVLVGTLYFSTDLSTLERSNGTAWTTYAPTATVVTAPFIDLTEGNYPNPPADVERIYALDVNGYTQVEMKDSAGRGARLASDNILIAKITEPNGITRGKVVYIAGAAGANPLVRLAKSDSISTMPAIGMVLDTGVVNAFTRVLLSGTLQGIDTSGFAEGVSLFVSPTSAGDLTSVLPVAPNYAQRVGFVTRSHATQGEVLILTTGTVTDPRLHHTTHEPGGTDQLVNAAWTNLPNVFTETQTLQKNGAALLAFVDTSQALDKKRFHVVASGSNFVISGVDDAGTVATGQLFYITHDGDVFANGNLTVNGAGGNVALKNIQNHFTAYQYIDTQGGAGDASLFLTNAGREYRILNYADNFRIWSNSVEVFILYPTGDLRIQGNLTVAGSSVIFGAADASHARITGFGDEIRSRLADDSDWAGVTARSFFAVSSNNSFADFTCRGGTNFQAGVNISAGGLTVQGGGAGIRGGMTSFGDLHVGSNSEKGNLWTTYPIYPGEYTTNWGEQTNWYLASHNAYGLFSNTGMYLSGGLTSAGGGDFGGFIRAIGHQCRTFGTDGPFQGNSFNFAYNGNVECWIDRTFIGRAHEEGFYSTR